MITYSGITNYGKASLPSVESWGTNNNILRDPPRSITTRRIDKVSDTSIIEQEQQDSSNRIAESILQFPRGINPMVSVNYGNNGGGFRTGGGTVPIFNSQGTQIGTGFMSGNVQAKLPYRVIENGAFRPPIRRQEDLYPLSRLPRNNTYVDPIAYTPDFTKMITCPGTAKDYRNVKNELLQVKTETSKHKLDHSKKMFLPGTAHDYRSVKNSTLDIKIPGIKVQKVEKPVVISTRGNVVNNRIKASATLNKSDKVERPVQVSTLGNVIQNKLQAYFPGTKVQKIEKPVAVSNGRQSTKQPLNLSTASNKVYTTNGNFSNKYTDSTIKNPVHVSANAVYAQNIHKKPVDSQVSSTYIALKRLNNIPIVANEKGTYQKNLPHEISSTRMKNPVKSEIPSVVSLSSMENTKNPRNTVKKINPTLVRGQIEPLPTIPLLDRQTNMGEMRLRDRPLVQKMQQMMS